MVKGDLARGVYLDLAIDDVDVLRGVVHARRQVRIVASRLVFAPPRTGKTRDVPLPELVALRLAAHLKAWPAVAVTLPWREYLGHNDPGFTRSVCANLLPSTEARARARTRILTAICWIATVARSSARH